MTCIELELQLQAGKLASGVGGASDALISGSACSSVCDKASVTGAGALACLHICCLPVTTRYQLQSSQNGFAMK